MRIYIKKDTITDLVVTQILKKCPKCGMETFSHETTMDTINTDKVTFRCPCGHITPSDKRRCLFICNHLPVDIKDKLAQWDHYLEHSFVPAEFVLKRLAGKNYSFCLHCAGKGKLDFGGDICHYCNGTGRYDSLYLNDYSFIVHFMDSSPLSYVVTYEMSHRFVGKNIIFINNTNIENQPLHDHLLGFLGSKRVVIFDDIDELITHLNMEI